MPRYLFLILNNRARRPGSCIFAALAWLGAMTIGLPTKIAAQDPAYVTAQAVSIKPHLEAYGQVEPISLLPVTAAESGVITGMNVLPGDSVHRGQSLARLSGPEIQAALIESQANVRSARAQLVASKKSLATLQQQLTEHLSTRRAIHQAQSALAQALANFENAETHLAAVRQMATLTSPGPATVVALNAAEGELVQAGQPVVTLQMSGRLWLRATYYGADAGAIRPGMNGVFSPSDGTNSIPVRVREVLGPMTAGGGASVALIPVVANAHWTNGEYGVLRLRLPPRTLVAVPTRALIIDRGKWWVLVHTAHGDRPQNVVPGPSRGWQTFLVKGLAPGAQVVVENAYLFFHRDIARRYQPPD